MERGELDDIQQILAERKATKKTLLKKYKKTDSEISKMSETDLSKYVDTLLICEDSHTRFPAFFKIKDLLPPKMYWEKLADSYTICDNLYEHIKKIRTCFSDVRLFSECLMSKSEIKFLKSLPESVKIYRGMTVKEFNSGKFGVSWTLDRKIAKFFANDYLRNASTQNEEKMVHSITINKADIKAYFSGRKEAEIIYLSNSKATKQ